MVPGPVIEDGVAGTSRLTNLPVALLLTDVQVALDPDTSTFPCEKVLDADTVMVFVPAPLVMVKPLGTAQL
jgi:hypothetical protein